MGLKSRGRGKEGKMNKAKKWLVGAQRGNLDIKEQDAASSPTEAFLRFTGRKKVWPKRAYAHLEEEHGDS